MTTRTAPGRAPAERTPGPAERPTKPLPARPRGTGRAAGAPRHGRPGEPSHGSRRTVPGSFRALLASSGADPSAYGEPGAFRPEPTRPEGRRSGEPRLEAAEHPTWAERRAGASEPRQDPLGAFTPAPQVLTPPPSGAVAPPVAGTAAAHQEAAALAERMIQSLRIGRSRERYEVRIGLGSLGRSPLEVRLSHERGVLKAVLVGEGADLEAATRLGQRLREELEERGIELDELDVRPT